MIQNIGVLLLALVMPLSTADHRDYVAKLAGDSAIVSGTTSERRSGSPGSSGSAGWSGGSRGAVVPVVSCARVDTVVMGTAELSQCVRSDGTDMGGPLSAIVEPVFDSDGNPVPPGPAAAPPVVVTATDLQSLPIVRGEVLVQPPGGPGVDPRGSDRLFHRTVSCSCGGGDGYSRAGAPHPRTVGLEL